MRRRLAGLGAPFAIVVLAGCATTAPAPIAVSGSGVHLFTTAKIHSVQPQAHGKTQRSTELIRIDGDLDGYVLYHPTTVIDAAANTLTNTGQQFFSGMVAGVGPLILHDDQFRFVVDLGSGATTGTVLLGPSKDAPDAGGMACALQVTGTGLTPEGDATFDYVGECTPRRR